MKKLFITLLATIAVATASAQIEFYNVTTDELHKIATEQKKLVFINVYATWCPPCRALERDVFLNKKVGEFFDENFISARYDADKSVGKELIKRYGNGSIPLSLVFDIDGNLLGRIIGASQRDELLKDLQRIIDKAKE